MTLGDRIRAYNHTFPVETPPEQPVFFERNGVKMATIGPLRMPEFDILYCPCGVEISIRRPIREDERCAHCPVCKSWHVILWREPVSR